MRELKLIPDQLTTVNLARFLFAIKKQKPDIVLSTKFAGDCLSDIHSYAQLVIKCRLHYSLMATVKSLFVLPTSVVTDGNTNHIYDRTGKLLVTRTDVKGDLADFVFAFDCSDFYPTKSLPADPAISAQCVLQQVQTYLFGGDTVRNVQLFNHGMQLDLTLQSVKVGSYVDYATQPDCSRIRRKVKVIGINHFQRRMYTDRNYSVEQIKPFIVIEYPVGKTVESRVIYPSQIVGVAK